jgi:hypothetical protein
MSRESHDHPESSPEGFDTSLPPTHHAGEPPRCRTDSARPHFTEDDFMRDKKLWGPGPWQDEPDQLDFMIEGYLCQLRRGQMGGWCGYVLVPEGHPWFDNRPRAYADAQVHGGISYGQRTCASCDAQVGAQYSVGFGYMHAGDYCPVLAAVLHHGLGRSSMLYPYPYDHAAALAKAEETGEVFMSNIYTDVHGARRETAILALQAHAVANGKPVPERDVQPGLEKLLDMVGLITAPEPKP